MKNHITLVSKLLIAATLTLALGACGSGQTDTRTETEGTLFDGHLIYESASFPSAHASTIVEIPGGIAAAWFGGSDEGEPDVGIWFARDTGDGWTAPVEVANGVQNEELRYPSWNPVLFQPADGPLVLFYKVGPTPREWWGLVRTSDDGGVSWSDEVSLPNGILGPIRAKPVLLEDGSLLAGSSTEHEGWVVHMERLLVPDQGSDFDMWSLEWLSSDSAWEKTGPLNKPEAFGAIQPTILVHSPTVLQIMCRSRQGVITDVWSEDAGTSWGEMSATALPNPSAGIDAVKLEDGRFLLIYNPTTTGRQQLGLAISEDGKAWEAVGLLENAAGEYSYPAMIRASDGLVHMTYTWKRERIKHVVVNPMDLN